MRTEVLQIHPQAPEAEAVGQAAAVIQSGGLVAFPTETVYGLGANALDPAAVARIYEAKGRPANNPLIVHAPDADAARELVSDWPEAAERLAARFWPGPLTLALPKRAVVPDIVTAGGPTVAIRVPAHPVALALLRAAGVPIAAPSANRSEQLSPTRAEHVLRGLDGRIELLLDAGPTSGGLESTVLGLHVSPPRLLRPGLIAPSELEAVIGPIQQAGFPVFPSSGIPENLSPKDPMPRGSEQPLSSPGQMPRHYAPRAPLELVAGSGAARVGELLAQGEQVGWVRRRADTAPDTADHLLDQPGLTLAILPSHPAEYAASLYAALHTLDDSGVTRIVVEEPPDSEAWLAVRDRLRRAAAPPAS